MERTKNEGCNVAKKERKKKRLKKRKKDFLPLCLPGKSADSAEPARSYCPPLVGSWNCTWTAASPLSINTDKPSKF